MNAHPADSPRRAAGSYWRSPYMIALLALGAMAGYFLWAEHRAHVSQWWPYALLLLCPLMHVFMHKGHGGGTHSGGRGQGDKTGQ
ncbi:Protein of uncharacterised function (DUF2933) [Achromobacter denitrificans]|uniref:DUF2933 domain-containing protein n=1 Tax=Achromobacter denitrificans TaxID=32002 RepID=UPI0007896FA7|nr:DUF2933 domain-containing protein [Achromobacter denitrificans]OLU09770.1 hypothetical protein BVK87_03225 [Achromobacter denitrificans]QKH43713.1 DUF2933 domain-containing protein [Achromobacter denitrificans]QKH49146.1 DUF2933 domain-containing protein [Achromobacter denitrificans]CAB3689409.1 hypothetical protein LMG1231_01998 [Achromobacter denitrificans]SUU11337.1 Protein of uncharacterised function (DUF2933) [Achromobacter denitrificans]